MPTNRENVDLADLLARTALRDRAAFRQLYEQTVRCLLAITVRLLRDQSWAEEVLQEAYVSIWNSAGNYSAAKAQPMTWLMTIARNRALDALRSTTSERETMVRPVVIDDDGDGEARLPDHADESAGPLESLVQRVDQARLRGCLQGLDAPQRQAIALAFYDGLSHSELAEHMRQPLGTVKAWVRRGLDRLQRCLGDDALAAT
jgi:RNA polymerase sigma-70 factor (ECF subfamily)